MKGTVRTAAFAAALALLLHGALAGDARAAHWGTSVDCYNCHDMNGDNVEPGTYSISKTAIAESKGHGWTSGMRLGCTFCHRSVNTVIAIADVLSSFSGDTPPGASRHPVARNFLTNVIDNGVPYLSSDNTAFDGHLDCRDCHDVTLVAYPNHDNNWLNNVGSAGRTRLTNPFALRGVNGLKRYDVLCRNCHGGAGAFTAFTGKAAGSAPRVVLSSHDNGADNAAGAIRDLDGTRLRTMVEYANNRQCSICHDAHESQNAHLFSDGHETDWNGTPETMIDEQTDCTSVCHYRGDATGNYDLHGHGKPRAWDCTVLGRGCTFCHDPAQPHRPGDNNYFVRYRFAAFDGSWLTPSVYGKPLKSVCATCHAEKPLHGPTDKRVGCVDCHDQHAKSSDGNVMMIRNTNRVPGTAVGVTSGPGSTIGSESVLFAKSLKYPAGDNIYHYYTNVGYGGPGTDNANPGVCDQRACHGARVNNGAPFWPLATYLVSGQHSGGNIATPSGNCEACHGHQDTAGTFRASASCTSCHGQPPPVADNTPGDIYLYNEALSPHRKHAGNNTGLGYYNFGCRACHVRYTDGATHNTGETLGYKTFQSVFFDNSVRRGTPAYDNGSMQCTNITCHSDGRGGPPNDNAQWFNPAQPLVRQRLTCAGCHNNTAPLAGMASVAHPRHIQAGFRCSACHVRTVSDNNTLLDPTSGMLNHVNGAVDVAIHASYDVDGNPLNNWDNATKTCSGVTCHGGAPVVWAAGPINCEPCHSYAAGIAVTANVYDYSYDNGLGTMSKVALGNFNSRGHGDNTGLPWDPGSRPGLACLTCHDAGMVHDNAANPFRFRRTVGGSVVQPDNVNSLCAASSCHPGYASRSDLHANSVTGGGQLGWQHTQKCVDCHDVHGQQNIFMVYDNLASRTDNSAWSSSDGYGIPRFPAVRSAVTYLDNATGAGFASVTPDGNYTNGICETCHTRTRQYQNTAANGQAGPGAHPTRRCVECHRHGRGSPAIDNGGGFAGVGGNNIEQFVDNALRPPSATNYHDRSKHPVALSLASTGPAGRTFTTQRDCLRCHGASGLPSTYQSNECLRCHNEFAWGTATYHPNGITEWAVPSAPSNVFGTGAATDGFCLQCHGPGGTGASLDGRAPDNVIPSGETWQGGSGHGSTTRLSTDTSVGPPAYQCRDCHYSSAPAGTSPNVRDNNAPTFHASINRKLVGSDNAANPEYPHPGDAVYNTIDARSGRMDWFCGTRCHGNASNGIPRDDNVVSHAWNVLGGPPRTGGQTHPSNMPPTPSARVRNPATLPLSEYVSGALPGSGNEVCVTCHNAHGGAAVVGASGAPLSGGAKQMMRQSFSDNASTICKECHL